MDHERVIATLEWWVKTASSARVSTYSNGRTHVSDYANKDAKRIRDLVAKEDQTRRVLARVLELPSLPIILSKQSQYVFVIDGIELCEYALGVLRSQEETRAMLGPSAPAMSADGLHPTVWNVVGGLWEQGHYRVCVQKAVTRLNGDIQDRLNRHDISDKKLMQQAFSSHPPQIGEPRLRWPGKDDDLSVVSMRDGMLLFSQGVFSAIRNMTTHTTEELPPQEAFEMLAAVSLLARWVDNCETVEV